MGMDLIGVGFTHRKSVTCTTDAIEAVLNKLPDAVLTDEVLEGALFDGNLEDASAEEVRATLLKASEEYIATIAGHRMTVQYSIENTDLVFTFAGGGSWGDEPYDDWNDLALFVAALEHIPQLREPVGFVTGGLPWGELVASEVKP